MFLLLLRDRFEFFGQVMRSAGEESTLTLVRLFVHKFVAGEAASATRAGGRRGPPSRFRRLLPQLSVFLFV